MQPSPPTITTRKNFRKIPEAVRTFLNEAGPEYRRAVVESDGFATPEIVAAAERAINDTYAKMLAQFKNSKSHRFDSEALTKFSNKFEVMKNSVAAMKRDAAIMGEDAAPAPETPQTKRAAIIYQAVKEVENLYGVQIMSTRGE